MDTREGLRLGDAADTAVLNDTVARLTLTLHAVLPAGLDLGTIATALIEIAAHAIVIGFPKNEQGPVVEHLQHYLMVAVDRWSNDPAIIAQLTRMHRERDARG